MVRDIIATLEKLGKEINSYDISGIDCTIFTMTDLYNIMLNSPNVGGPNKTQAKHIMVRAIENAVILKDDIDLDKTLKRAKITKAAFNKIVDTTVQA